MTMKEIADKAKEYKELQNFIKQLQDEAEAIKADITATMEAEGTDTVRTDLFTVKWTQYQTSRLDSKKLKNVQASTPQPDYKRQSNECRYHA